MCVCVCVCAHMYIMVIYCLVNGHVLVLFEECAPCFIDFHHICLQITPYCGTSTKLLTPLVQKASFHVVDGN